MPAVLLTRDGNIKGCSGVAVAIATRTTAPEGAVLGGYQDRTPRSFESRIACALIEILAQSRFSQVELAADQLIGMMLRNRLKQSS
jgi:hypothetical protein